MMTIQSNLFTYFFYGLIGLLISFEADGQGYTNAKGKNSIPFAQYVQQIEKSLQVKIVYNPRDLPNDLSQISIQEEISTDNLGSLLSSWNWEIIAYNEYLHILISREVWSRNYTSDFYDHITTVDSAQLDSTILIAGVDEFFNPNGFGMILLRVVNGQSGDPIVGAVIQTFPSEINAVTDTSGIANVELPLGLNKLLITGLGITDQEHTVYVVNDGSLTVKVFESIEMLEQVVVIGRVGGTDALVEAPGLNSLSSKAIKEIPTLLGETDVIKAIEILPGIHTAGEASNGFYVRGGGIDQNLILLDEIFIFNPTHAFGLFGSVNADVINSINLYKGISPANVGGRLSSVLDINMKKANSKRYKMAGGISPVFAKVALEVPISKRSSVLTGVRSTYSDWILKRINNPDIQASAVSFQDFNFRYDYQPVKKVQLFLNGYWSNDKFRFSNQFANNYQTTGISAGILYNPFPGFESKTSWTQGEYDTSLEELEGSNKSILRTFLDYWKLDHTLRWIPEGPFQIMAGFSSIGYKIRLGEILPTSEYSIVQPSDLGKEQSTEVTPYLQSNLEFRNGMVIQAGLRINRITNYGPGIRYIYKNSEYPESKDIIDSTLHIKGKPIERFYDVEPRISLLLPLDNYRSISCGYSKISQSIFQLSQTDAALPTAIWKLSNKYYTPQKGNILSLSLQGKSRDDLWIYEFSLYGKLLKGISLLRDFANLTGSEQIETQTVPAAGKAYGVEFKLQKSKGRLNGLLAYTWSRSLVKSETSAVEHSINKGAWFSSSFDQPHVLGMRVAFDINNRHSFSLNFNFSSGHPVTAPVSFYDSNDLTRIPVYGDRNGLRIPNYHRLDLSYSIGHGHRRNKKWKSFWTFTVYNLYARKNAYSVYFTQSTFSNVRANKFSLIGSAIPSLSYNFVFENGK